MSCSIVSAATWLLFFSHAASGAFMSQIQPCPDFCGDKDPQDWTVYSGLEPLSQCNQPILFDFNIHTDVDAHSVFKVRACNAGKSMPLSVAHVTEKSSDLISREESSGLISRDESDTTSVSFQLITEGASSASSASSASAASTAAGDYTSILSAMQKRLQSRATDDAEPTILFGYSNGVAVGMYAGRRVDPNATPQVFKHLLAQQPQSQMRAQLCGDDRTANYIYGLSVNTDGDISSIRKDILTWDKAQCVEAGSGSNSQSFSVQVAESTTSSSSVNERRSGSCKTITVVSGDGCGSLAKECGISANDFSKYNKQHTNLCSTLSVGEKVCCSSGGLPNWQPGANKDGTCVVYKVKAQDNCDAIASNYGWTQKDLHKFNDKVTWGWSGCDPLPNGIAMCVSKGTPPLPASVENAECGPIVPGTKDPKNGTEIADLNPCPLNSCCDMWGHCGITEEYCNDDRGPTGNPGTAPKGKIGCISNCGTNVTNNDDPPSDFISIGYYEQFNWERSCLNMRVEDLKKDSGYTHIHWAFAGITDDFSVNITDSGDQWKAFVDLKDFKRRIVSFGGWGYSTDPATYATLRKAMTEEHRTVFVHNLVDFAHKYSLEGIDIDWEYPGEQDIPGIPPGEKSDGANYLSFLKELKDTIDDGMTVSIAAPASYWYLKQFPIKEMSEVVDYMVYMTYDLHGQWDYGNKFSQEGCPNGNCLRSHVNLTETEWALAMITKAGVKANKVTVGISSYGRAFGMTDKSCVGPDCTFEGKVVDGTGGGSTADPGRCTATSGYISNAEIDELIANGKAKTSYDEKSKSDIATWDSTWAAYQSVDTRVARTNLYKSLGFAGVIDWAVDLLRFTGDDGDRTNPDDDTTGDDLYPLPDLSCSDSYDSLEAIQADADKIPSICASIYMVEALQKFYNSAMDQYNDLIADGYDKKFKIYAGVVVDHAGDSMTQMIYENGDKYFDCEVYEVTFCCKTCNTFEDHNCDYCRKDNSDCTQMCNPVTGVCTGDIQSKRELYSRVDSAGLVARDARPNPKYIKVKEPCPPDYSKHGYGETDVNGTPESTIWWSFQDDKSEANFYADLYSETAIPKNKTSLQRNLRFVNTCGTNNPPDDDSCLNVGVDYDIPYPHDYGQSDVINPKDVVKQANGKVADLKGQIDDALTAMKAGLYQGDFNDIVDSITIPIMMINTSVTQMGTIEDVAEKITKEKRMAMILGFLGAILFLVPVAGELLGSVAELAEIGAIVSAAGAAGNLAFDIYTVATDPKNAPLAIMSIIFEPLALLDIAKVAKAAKIRNAMSAGDIAKLGDQVKPVLDMIDSIKTKSTKCAL